MTKDQWELLPFEGMASPVSAITTGQGGVWVGWGGVAWYSDVEGWRPPDATIAVHSITSLAYGNGVLLAGHESGIARSVDGGKTWVEADVSGASIGPVERRYPTMTDFALSPHFAEDGVALAGSFGNGVFRTTDAGHSWRLSNFGLDEHEVMALAWRTGESVVSGTKAGLFHSPNGGRAWRAVPNTADFSFSTLTWLPDGRLLAAQNEDRPIIFSADLLDLVQVEALPYETTVWGWAATVLPDGAIFLGNGVDGIWASDDSGQSWTQLWDRETWALASDGERLYAGTNSGLATSEDRGRSWTFLPPPPLESFQWLLPLDDELVLAGAHSELIFRSPNGGWARDDTGPSPLHGTWWTGPRSFVYSAWNGLILYEIDKDCEWERVVDQSGCTMATFLGDDGWAGITSDGHLLRTRDGGRTWGGSPSAFGHLPLVALQAIPKLEDGQFGYLMAATYDERSRSVKVWRSDDGEHWTPGADSYTPWPHVATLGEPAVVTVGSVISTRQADGTWNQATAGETSFRRVVFDDSTLYALALDALWRSDDFGKSWSRDDEVLPANELLDIAIFQGKLHVLLTGGRLLARVT
jgi:photosystem II stability/assembly factor-like uncharacterized protein